MDTTNQNLIIASFMGLWESEVGFLYSTQFERGFRPTELLYDSSWDWLMPVVEKISQTVIEGHEPFNSDQFVRVEIIPNGYVQISNLRDTPIFSNVSSSGSLITAVWIAVVRFIIWYNTKNNDTSRAEI